MAEDTGPATVEATVVVTEVAMEEVMEEAVTATDTVPVLDAAEAVLIGRDTPWAAAQATLAYEEAAIEAPSIP